MVISAITLIYNIVTFYIYAIIKLNIFQIMGGYYMIIKCIDNSLCSTLTLNKEYFVLEEAPEYYVIFDDVHEEITCKKSRFTIITDGDLTKKCKATVNELNYQLNNDFKDIKSFSIRKNSKGEIKEVSIKFKY